MTDVVELFLARAADHPDHPAVIEDAGPTSYGALADRARAIAAAIAATGEAPRVLVLLPQCAEAYAAMMGAGMAGAVYAPVNVGAPTDKQRRVVERFEPDVVVGRRDLYDTLFPAGGPAFVDAAAPGDGRLPAPRPWHRLAYVIFTSGSTGLPKGVAISRQALRHYVDWVFAAMAPGPADRWSQHPNIGFDLSVLDIYGALCSGATLYPLTGAVDRMMPGEAIRRHRLTIWDSVPSVVSMMIQARQATPHHLESLRLMTFCGEPLLPEHLDAIFAARPDLTVHNTYGPTEATVSMTLVTLDATSYRNHCRASVALGDPIPGMGLHLMGGPGPDEGEIVITGPQLAEGYWRDDDATLRAFRDVTIDGRRMRGYHTGDWARRIDGVTYFATRLDNQVKIRGFRLDLGEVEAALRKCGHPVAACALVDGELTAFIETADPARVDPDALRASMADAVEAHAVPKSFHVLDTLPRNANDKIDVRALIARFETERNNP